LQFAVAYAAILTPSAGIITTHLEEALHRNNAANIFITLKEDTSQVLANIRAKRFADRGAKLNAIHAALVNHAERTQEPIISFLSTQPQQFQVKSFWITNQIYIRNVDSALVSALADKFSHLISSIDEEFFAHLIEPVSVKTNVSIKAINHQWGVLKIQAPEAWEELGGVLNAGEGVIIATIDTGVRVTHEALRDNFVGDYGWFDPSTGTPGPTDTHGHGTHTTGTIVGSKGIGVAPKAKWAACRGCAEAFCSQHDLTDCGQFVFCPTLPDGSNPDCSKAPHIVSNSWGGGRGATWYNGIIEIWHDAEIIPIYSIGNLGPACDTASSPGDHKDVIGVGSTTDGDEISYFSSNGPTVDKRMKPDISGPGTEVVSAFYTSDTAYASYSGTSMACPHVSGTVALLMTRDKGLTYEDAKNLLLENTDKELTFSGRTCEGIGDRDFPNHQFGWGRVNALKTVRAQTRRL